MAMNPMHYDDKAALGQNPGVSVIHKFGYQGAVTTTEMAIWDLPAVYVYPASASVMKVSSASTDDKGVPTAGTGARTVQVYGLDADYAEQNETVILNGQTAVLTIGIYIRIFRVVVLTAGSGGANAGIIYVGTGTVTTGVPAVKHAAVSIGENQTLMSVYTVPAGKNALLRRVTITADSNQSGLGKLVSRPFGGVFNTRDKWALDATTSSMMQFHYDPPVMFAEKTDIELRGDAAASTMIASGSFDLLLLDCSVI